MSKFIAIVQQPACTNVFLVTTEEAENPPAPVKLAMHAERRRLYQHASSRARGYAEAAAHYEAAGGAKLRISEFECEAGDAAKLTWTGTIVMEPVDDKKVLVSVPLAPLPSGK